MNWTLVIMEASPSQNVWDRWHWRDKWASKAKWKMLIRAAAGFIYIPKATVKRSLTVHRCSPGTLDESNLIGGLKGVIDALVQLGVLVDDRPEFLDLKSPIQTKPKGREKPHTILILEEVA